MAEIERREYLNGRVVLIHGDSVDLLMSGHIKGFDATITDPPYMLGAISAGDKKSKGGRFLDLQNFSAWYAMWIGRCVEGGRCTAVFGNWRSIPVYQAAFSACAAKTFSCVVWDKEWLGPGQYIRPSWECIMIGGTSPLKIVDRRSRDVVRHKWCAAHSGRYHPAEKPVPVVSRVVEWMTAHDQVVLDPFMGSGTTGVAAINKGRRFIGIEIDRQHFEVACQRIEQAVNEQGQCDVGATEVAHG